MRKFAVILFVLNLLFAGLFAAVPQKAFEQANAMYKAGNYDGAAVEYETIVKQGYQSAEVYYNLGNCYYKAGRIGKSILNYERALKLNPADEDIQHNLKLAGLKTADKFQPVPQLAVVTWWNNFSGARSSGSWAWVAVILLWLSLLFAAVYLFIGNYRKLIFTTGVFFLLSSMFILLVSVNQHSKAQDAGKGVLISETAYVKSAPDAQGTDVFIIHEGATFKILESSEEWYKIRLEDGKVGWLTKNYFDKV
jgi:tetratricopeptide (TPR) repeat protein